MAIALVVDTEALSSGTGGNDAVTSGVDTTGATLLVLVLCAEGAAEPTISDSKTNSWTKLTQRKNAASTKYTTIYYSVPTSVGAAHTFTASSTLLYPAIAMLAFSGTHASSPFDTENGANQDTGLTLQPGSITPSVDDCVVVTGLNINGVTLSSSIDSSYIETADLPEAGDTDGIHAAYIIQTTAAATNPTWTASGGAAVAACIASFKPPAVAVGYLLVKN